MTREIDQSRFFSIRMAEQRQLALAMSESNSNWLAAREVLKELLRFRVKYGIDYHPFVEAAAAILQAVVMTDFPCLSDLCMDTDNAMRDNLNQNGVLLLRSTDLQFDPTIGFEHQKELRVICDRAMTVFHEESLRLGRTEGDRRWAPRPFHWRLAALGDPNPHANHRPYFDETIVEVALQFYDVACEMVFRRGSDLTMIPDANDYVTRFEFTLPVEKELEKMRVDRFPSKLGTSVSTTENYAEYLDKTAAHANVSMPLITRDNISKLVTIRASARQSVSLLIKRFACPLQDVLGDFSKCCIDYLSMMLSVHHGPMDIGDFVIDHPFPNWLTKHQTNPMNRTEAITLANLSGTKELRFVLENIAEFLSIHGNLYRYYLPCEFYRVFAALRLGCWYALAKSGNDEANPEEVERLHGLFALALSEMINWNSYAWCKRTFYRKPVTTLADLAVCYNCGGSFHGHCSVCKTRYCSEECFDSMADVHAISLRHLLRGGQTGGPGYYASFQGTGGS